MIDAAGNFAGVLTQNHAAGGLQHRANKFGLDEMDNQESKRLVGQLLKPMHRTIQPLLPLLEAGHYFIDCKHGCLPVLENSKVVGILNLSRFCEAQHSVAQSN